MSFREGKKINEEFQNLILYRGMLSLPLTSVKMLDFDYSVKRNHDQFKAHAVRINIAHLKYLSNKTKVNVISTQFFFK